MAAALATRSSGPSTMPEIPPGRRSGSGSNGSGRSTLLGCIAGIRTQQGGSAAVAWRRCGGRLGLNHGPGERLPEQHDPGHDARRDRAQPSRSSTPATRWRSIDQPVKNYPAKMTCVRLRRAITSSRVLLVDEVPVATWVQEKCMESSRTQARRPYGRRREPRAHQMRTFCTRLPGRPRSVANIGNASDVIGSYVNDEHGAQSVDGAGTRYGTGESADRRDQSSPATSQPPPRGLVRAITLRMHYTAKKRIPDRTSSSPWTMSTGT